MRRLRSHREFHLDPRREAAGSQFPQTVQWADVFEQAGNARSHPYSRRSRHPEAGTFAAGILDFEELKEVSYWLNEYHAAGVPQKPKK